MKSNTSEFTTPEQLWPFPKAKDRTKNVSNRKKTTSRILTDTPEKDEIERFFIEKQRKEELKKRRQAVRNIAATKRKAKEVESSEEEDTYSTDSNSSEISDEIFESEEQALIIGSLKQGDYVLTKIAGKKSTYFYVADIINNGIDEFQVKYLKRMLSTNKFIKESEEIFAIGKENIVLSLPQPTVAGLSERQRNMLNFGIDFSSYKVE